MGFVLPFTATAAFGDAFFGQPAPQVGTLTFTSQVFSNGSVSATITGGSFSSVNAGQFEGFFDPNAQGGSPPPQADDYLRFLCIDITHLADTGSGATYTLSTGAPSTLSASQVAEMTRLFDTYYPNKTTGTYFAGGVDTNFGSFATANDSAAFQLALWEIVFGTGTDLTMAPFTASSAAEAEAQMELNVVDSESGTPAGWTFYTLTSDVPIGTTPYQEYLTVEYGRTLQQTPEPEMLLLFGSATLAAWAAALRRRQT
jgi:PEP-CTERM motif